LPPGDVSPAVAFLCLFGSGGAVTFAGSVFLTRALSHGLDTISQVANMKTVVQ
jgi:hypothetical protein